MSTWDGMRNAYNMLIRKPGRNNHLGGGGIDWRIILK
jgi:hypothetical protein